MALFKILEYPHPVLKMKAQPVKKFDKRLHNILDSMKETLVFHDGLGLAAPQIGVSERFAIVNTDDGYYELINPVLIAHGGTQTGVEGCLSVPKKYGEVTRYRTIKVKALDRYGKEHIFHVQDLTARAFQHEMDHLDGIMYISKCKDGLYEA